MSSVGTFTFAARLHLSLHQDGPPVCRIEVNVARINVHSICARPRAAIC
jgi:hypothetical protein